MSDDLPSDGGTLFVVTHGSYSSYTVLAIFSDRVLAERFCEGTDDSTGDGRRIEEYPLNPDAAHIRAGLKAHYVSLDRDGHVLSHHEAYGGTAEAGRVTYVMDGIPPTLRRKSYCFKASVIAKTKEQAIKAANEQRARWIAEGREWPEDELAPSDKRTAVSG